jgi:hypothetical protein
MRSPEGLKEADCVSVKKPFPVPHRSSAARGSFRVFGFAARSAGVSAHGSSTCEVGVAFRVFTRRSIAVIGLAIPLCRWHWPRLWGFPAADPAGRNQVPSSILSSRSLSFRVLPSEPYPARRSPRDPLMDFLSLQHIRIRRSVLTGVPRPDTFRLQGLVTLLAAYSLRTPAGLVSCPQRSWDYPFGAFSSRKVSPRFPAGRTRLSFTRPAF